MPPKKEEKKAKPSSTKMVADKASICPYSRLGDLADACLLDVRHEKREPSHPNPFPQLDTAPIAFSLRRCAVLMEE